MSETHQIDTHSAQGLWKQILHYVHTDYPQHYRPWFAAIKGVEINEGGLVLSGPQQYQEHIENCEKYFVEAAASLNKQALNIEYRPISPTPLSSPDSQSVLSAHFSKDSFHTDFNFDNFVVDTSNRMPHNACLTVSRSPGRIYNPLFIYGPSGIGKTHLMQSTALSMMHNHPELKVAYIPCRSFTTQIVQAIEQDTTNELRRELRSCDAILVDDIHFLQENPRSQEEFFHLFNTLFESRRQIVLSSDTHPTALQGLPERLISRFYQGLVTCIDKPSYETRITIVEQKSHNHKINIPEDVARYVAHKSHDDIRRLEGCLMRIHNLAATTQEPITLRLAHQALGEPIDDKQHKITIAQIIQAVTDRFNVRLSDLQSKRRSRAVVFPRQLCMYLARDLTGTSLEEIGVHFGCRNHTTVLHSYRKIDQLYDRDEKVRSTVKTLVSGLKQAQ